MRRKLLAVDAALQRIPTWVIVPYVVILVYTGDSYPLASYLIALFPLAYVLTRACVMAIVRHRANRQDQTGSSWLGP